MHSEIELTRNLVAIVDAADFEYLSQWKWCAMSSGRGVFYPGRANKPHSPLRMHRQLMGLGLGDRRQVDHVNGNTLDNRRENLRVCLHRNNLANQDRHAGATGYKGVWRSRTRGSPRYIAYISDGSDSCTKPNRICLGSYNTAEAAAREWDRAALRLRGEFATLNFPREDYT